MPIHWHVTVKPEFQRRAEVQAALANAHERRRFHQMSNPRDLPVIRIDISTPVYRMTNGRTQTKQLEAIAQHGLDRQYFLAGQEDVTVQQTQHEFLVDLANQGQGDSIQPISEALEVSRIQTDPLLILPNGVVLNGNRRLASMRELFGERPGEFPTFSQVEVLVLPEGIDAREERRIETRLQMARETRLPYDWISQALVVRDMQESGMSDTEIADLMQLRNVSEVAEMVERLNEADIYLAEVVRRPSAYGEIVGAKRHFEDMVKKIAPKTGVERELSRKIAHAIQRNKDAFGARVYDYKEAYGRDAIEVAGELAERFGVAIQIDNGNATTGAPQDDDIFASAPDPHEELGSIIPLLEDTDRAEEVAEAIRDIEDALSEGRRQGTAERAALQKLQRVSAQLAGLNFDQASRSTYPGIRAQLATIGAEVARLSADIEGRFVSRES